MLQEESSRSEPFLSPETIPTPIDNNSTNEINNNNNNEQHHDELQFYDPTAILDISRDVAFGYLILLTGGAVEYEAPTLEEVQQQQDTTTVTPNEQQSTPSSCLDEESASLAYASIVDGNVLYACFGLKTIVGNSSSSSIPTIGGKQHSSSIFCCFPDASLDALQLVLPQSSKNKLKMQKLCEVLRDVSDLHLETLENEGTSSLSATPTKIPLYVQIINAYVNLFSSIVKYHDTKKHLKKKNDKGAEKKKKNDVFKHCCSDLFSKLNPFSKTKNVALEQLQKDTLLDIGNSFKGLNNDIWHSLERMATQTAFTGVSVE